MGKMLDGLLRLQATERKLAHVRGRLKARQNAVNIQQRRIDQLQEKFDAVDDQSRTRRRGADRLELDLKSSEEMVSKLRSALNTAKTNKEYAAILTQINTRKADNAKLEEEVLRIMQEVDSLRAEADKVRAEIEAEKKRLETIQQTNADEIAKLTAMMEELQAERTEAAKGVNSDALSVFERVAESYNGEAMAPIEVNGKKPPYTYICGGCYMTLNAEHANALAVRDEVRVCDNCGRILYPEPKQEPKQEPMV